MPVKLRPGKVYWVGVNSPQHQNFKSASTGSGQAADGTPARPYQILFATRSADGKPTPLPAELVKQAAAVNSPSVQPATRPSTAREAIDAAVPVAEAWLALMDDGKYGESWEQAAKAFREKVPKGQWIEGARSVREPLGRVRSRELINATYTTSLPGAPDGRYVILQYRTRLANRKDAVETVTPMLDEDGAWRVSGYYVK